MTEATFDTALLSVQSLSKSFGGIKAVDEVSFTIGRGEVVGLIGPNGAGKTTLFNCVCGQLRPDEGRIDLNGTRIDRLPVYRRARLGIGRTFQRVEVFGELTVREHFLIAERARRGDGSLWKDILNRGGPRADELRRVDEVLDLVGLASRAELPVSALSLGGCRLVELGRALVAEPTLLMADEPSSGLDAQETMHLAEVLSAVQAQRAMTVVLVEHDLAMVKRVADRVIVMDVGRVIAAGELDVVMVDPLVRQAYLGVAV